MHIPLNLNDVSEPKPVPNGRYALTVASAEQGVSKTGNNQIRVSLGIEGHIDAPNVTHYISIPGQNDEPSKANFKLLMLKRFLTHFKIPFDDNGFEVDKFLGARAECELTLSEPDDSGNVYNRLMLPKMTSEGAKAGTPAPKPPKKG